eukprot:CAMPEP_0184683948 /NCGR_PEP_ID=MMETSP0312-20130426/13303_1 /TAXON_ID=31354 /ORGANISM="Compsopogon coeruleus, Strain SAG 36.94" /LENGTH=309 /DNA_ID=CAMNT_0027136697 /DNA_START=12 /DNA_END=938 /DNA_ORIENTATION=-
MDIQDRRSLGRTGIMVSPMGFGGSPLGGIFSTIDEEDAVKAVHEAVRRGVNFFDVSPYYGMTKAEKLLGRALKDIPRDSVVVSTKVGRYGFAEFDFSADRVTASLQESMERLNVDYLDAVFCHDIEFARDLNEVVEQTIPTLQRLKASGKIRAIGISGYPLEAFRYVLDRAPENSVDLVLSYCHNCLNDSSLLDMMDYFDEKGVGVINASPLCMGLLTNGGGPDWHPAPPELKDAAKRAASIAAARGVDISYLALKYALKNTRVATTLVGIDSCSILEKNISGFKMEEPSPDLLKEILDEFSAVHNRTW